MVNPITDFFKFLYDDFKSDIDALRKASQRIGKGEPIFDPKKVEELKLWWKSYSMYKFLSENWLFFLLLTLAVLSGFWLASQHYQDVCNQYIIDHYIEKETLNWSFNWTSR
jgi:hypothetical protein